MMQHHPLPAITLVLVSVTVARPDTVSTAVPSTDEMARRIDALIARRWTELGLQPAARSTDSEFLRRVSLDLTGATPRVSQVRNFLEDDREDKRARLIDELLQSPAHMTHMARRWTTALLSVEADTQQLEDVARLQQWIRDQFVENMRYDRLVADLLVARGNLASGPGVFFTAHELKPEVLAARTARVFLGLRIECAQCHDHPYDRWTQPDFWGYAAFFARLSRDLGNTAMDRRLLDTDRGEVRLPNTGAAVPPKFPGGPFADESAGGSRRMQLALWLASRHNPYFARAAVNRVWAHMFGRGLVEPLDDLGDHNPPSHPELLNELAAYFTQTRFDLRQLLRTLANTRTYQLSSQGDAGDAPSPDTFARMAVKALSAEQLYDSMSRSRMRNPMGSTPPQPQPANRLGDPRRLAFILKMQSPPDSAQFSGGVPQALTLINGNDMVRATTTETSGLLASLEAPWFTDQQRVETLFLATLSRFPDNDERVRFAEFLRRADRSADRQRALGDVLWALLNCSEFRLNH